MKKILFLLLCTAISYGQTYQNPTFGTIKSKTSTITTTPTDLVTKSADGTYGHVLSVMNQNAQTGVTSFDGLSVNADPTKYNIGAGVGYISNPQTGEVKKVTWSNQTAQTTPYLATSVATYVLKDDTGATVMQNSYPTPTQFRTHIYLGKLAHTTFTTILFAVTEPNRAYHVSGDLHDLINTFGSLNRSGNVITPNGANLQINVSAGETYREGANFTANTNSPNITSEPAVNATSFRNKFRNGSGGWTAVNTTTVDPNYYDNGSGILQVVPNNKWTIKVVYRFGGTGTIHMDYGQTIYDNLTAADAGISNSVSSDPDTKNFASRIGWIIIQQGTTSLLDATKYKFVPADKIGERAASATGTTTMQGAYNNSVTPQIVTTTTGGALAIKRGSADDTDNILVGQNGAGANTFAVTGDGNITGGTYNGYTPENVANKSDSYTVSSSTTYASTKALVDGLATKAPISGSSNYIQNQASSAQSADAWIGGTLRVDSAATFSSSIGYQDRLYPRTNTVVDWYLGRYISSGYERIENALGSGTAPFTIGQSDYFGNYTPNIFLRADGSATFSSSVTASSIIKSGGTSSQFLKADGSVDSTSYAQIASPALTGTPTAPTATAGTNTTQIATTAFVQTANSNNIKISGESNQTINSDVVVNGTLDVVSTVASDGFVTNGGLSSQKVNGDGSLSVGYKVYTALLSQSGTSAPTATVLENTLGESPVWSYNSTGSFIGTTSGAIFISNKTTSEVSGGSQLGLFSSYSPTTTTINIQTANTSGSAANGILAQSKIEIRVYN